MLRKELGEKLPDLLNIARVISLRTNESVQDLFRSLVVGVKRSSPRLIDNTGLILRLGEANDTYAEKIGKTTDQLSAQERTIALLNATLVAGNKTVALSADIQESAGLKIQKIGVIYQNTLDRISLGTQGLYEASLDFQVGIAKIIEDVGDLGAESLEILGEITQTVVSGIHKDFAVPIGGVIKNVADTLFQFLKDITLGFAKAIGTFFGFLAASLVNARTLIERVLGSIGKMLIGGSPPPEGPLKDVDKGARAIGQAWLEGFLAVDLDGIVGIVDDVNRILTGVPSRFDPISVEEYFLQPAEHAGREVERLLRETGIGSFSLKRVESELERLDDALKPFENRLKLVNAQFEEMTKPAESAISAIERQTNRFLQHVVDGNAEAAAFVRGLNERAEFFDNQIAFGQQSIDQWTIQLALAKAQQAEERALLEIRKDQFDISKSQSDNDKKDRDKKPKKPKKPPKGKKQDPEVEDPEVDPYGLNYDNDLIGNRIHDFLGELGDEFSGAYVASLRKGGLLGTLGIGEVDPVDGYTLDPYGLPIPEKTLGDRIQDGLKRALEIPQQLIKEALIEPIEKGIQGIIKLFTGRDVEVDLAEAVRDFITKPFQSISNVLFGTSVEIPSKALDTEYYLEPGLFSGIFAAIGDALGIELELEIARFFGDIGKRIDTAIANNINKAVNFFTGDNPIANVVREVQRILGLSSEEAAQDVKTQEESEELSGPFSEISKQLGENLRLAITDFLEDIDENITRAINESLQLGKGVVQLGIDSGIALANFVLRLITGIGRELSDGASVEGDASGILNIFDEVRAQLGEDLKESVEKFITELPQSVIDALASLESIRDTLHEQVYLPIVEFVNDLFSPKEVGFSGINPDRQGGKPDREQTGLDGILEDLRKTFEDSFGISIDEFAASLSESFKTLVNKVKLIRNAFHTQLYLPIVSFLEGLLSEDPAIDIALPSSEDLIFLDTIPIENKQPGIISSIIEFINVNILDKIKAFLDDPIKFIGDTIEETFGEPGKKLFDTLTSWLHEEYLSSCFTRFRRYIWNARNLSRNRIGYRRRTR